MSRCESQIKAEKEYSKKRKIKPVSFNAETDKEYLDIIDSLGMDFSSWVKKKLKEEKFCRDKK